MSETDFHFTFHFSIFQYPLSQDTDSCEYGDSGDFHDTRISGDSAEYGDCLVNLAILVITWFDLIKELCYVDSYDSHDFLKFINSAESCESGDSKKSGNSGDSC